jgi:hypothetical protein
MEKTDKEKAFAWFKEGNDLINMHTDEQKEYFEKHYAYCFDEEGNERPV